MSKIDVIDHTDMPEPEEEDTEQFECMVCRGACINTDPDDYEHMAAEWDEFVQDVWLANGTTPKAIWAFIASTTLTIARDNGQPWDTFVETLKSAWERAEAAAQADEKKVPSA